MTESVLPRADHALLCAWEPSANGPRLSVSPSPVWWDGQAVWITVPAGTGELADPVTLLVGGGHAPATVAVSGPPRVHGPRDLRGLILHAPMIATALGALALRAEGTGALPPRRAVARIVVEASDQLDGLVVGPGVAPALPTDVPADVRRAVTGRRMVALLRPDTAGARAVVWGPGFALEQPGPPARRVAVVVGGTATTGVALEGELGGSGVLRPERALWWSGGMSGSAAVTSGAIVLPE